MHAEPDLHVLRAPAGLTNTGLDIDFLLICYWHFSGVQHMLGGNIPMGKLFLEPYSMTKWHVMIRCEAVAHASSF